MNIIATFSLEAFGKHSYPGRLYSGDLKKMLLEDTEGGSTYSISANENCVSSRV